MTAKADAGKRKRGRPAARGTDIHVSIAPGQLAELDDWIEQQARTRGLTLSRPDSIRILLAAGLDAEQHRTPRRFFGRVGAAKAALRKRYRRPYSRPWSEQDEALLREMVQAGELSPEIATALDRTVSAVKARRHLLGIKRPPEP